MLDRSEWIFNVRNYVKNVSYKFLIGAIFVGFTIASIVSSFSERLLLQNPEKSLQDQAKVAIPELEKPQSSLTKGAINKIVERNIFNIEGKVADDLDDKDKKEEKAVDYGAGAVKSDLPLKLVGIIYTEGVAAGLALIEDTGKKAVNSFMVGDMVVPKVKLAEIQRDRVILERDGHNEFINLDQKEITFGRKKKAGPAAPVKKKDVPAADRPSDEYVLKPPVENYSEEGFERKGTNITMSSDFKKKLLSTDFAKVLQDAKAEPFFDQGELSGFRLTRLRQDSVYEKAGLQNDDVIKEINGVSLIDTAQAVKLLNSLRDENEIEVRLIRGGKLTTVNMRVK